MIPTIPTMFGRKAKGIRETAAPAVPTMWVDSVGGLDANSGRTSLLPKQTLAAAVALAGSNEYILLKKGSSWRESFNLTAKTAPRVDSYGTGAAPIIRGDDVVTAWTKTSGLTYVYEASITHDATGTNRLTVYEDGILMTRVTSNALCDATAGTFVDAKGSDGATITFKIHATGDGNPASNGKVYEVTRRTNGLAGPNASAFAGIQTMRVISNNGSMDLVDRTAVTANRILAVNGTKHNMGIGSGSAKDCITFQSDATTSYELANTSFVAFLNNGSGKSYLFERCGAVDTIGTDYIAHGSPTGFDSGVFRQNWTVNTPFAAYTTLNEGCYYRNNTAVAQAAMSMCLIEMAGGAATSLTGAVADTVIKTSAKAYAEFWRNNGGSLTNCGHVGDGNGSTWMLNGSAAAMAINKTIFFGGVNMIFLPSGSTYVGNYNVFYAEAGATMYFNKGTGTVSSLAAWQTDSGQDSQSVRLAAADQTAGNPYAFWLARANNVSLGAYAGDWTINPNARVYNSAGTAFIGTFPDGTLITTAGPLNHWDWNARASVAGPPLKWPTVPSTLAEAQTYIGNPTGWNFYP